MIRYSIITFLIYILVFSVNIFAKEKFVVKRAKEEVILLGYTRKERSKIISSEVSGKVLKVNYDIGDSIKDKPFIEIDPTFILFQIKKTKLSIKKMDINIQKIISRITYLEKEFYRIDTLYKKDRATEVKRDAAAEELQQAKLQLSLLKQEKAFLETTLQELIERKRRYNINAPKGWIVTERNVEPGEIVKIGVPLAKVSNYRRLVVPLSVTSDELSAIKSLPRIFDAKIEGNPVKASIHWINPAFDEKTRKLKIEIIIKKYKGEKRGGLRFTLPIFIKTQELLIPKAAVTKRYDNPTVRLKETGEIINIVIIKDIKDYFIVKPNKHLAPGTELVEVGSGAKK